MCVEVIPFYSLPALCAFINAAGYLNLPPKRVVKAPAKQIEASINDVISPQGSHAALAHTITLITQLERYFTYLVIAQIV